MMKRTTLLAVAVLAFALAVPAGIAGASAQERPFRANVDGYTTGIVFANQNNPLETSTFGGRCSVASNWVISFAGTGTAAHLGRFTWTSSHCTQLGANPPASVTLSDGQFEYVAANGDVLYETYGSSRWTVLTPTLACIDTDAEFTGGTGRFANASGSAVEHTCWDPITNPGPVLSAFTITSAGTITYAASDRAH